MKSKICTRIIKRIKLICYMLIFSVITCTVVGAGVYQVNAENDIVSTGFFGVDNGIQAESKKKVVGETLSNAPSTSYEVTSWQQLQDLIENGIYTDRSGSTINVSETELSIVIDGAIAADSTITIDNNQVIYLSGKNNAIIYGALDESGQVGNNKFDQMFLVDNATLNITDVVLSGLRANYISEPSTLDLSASKITYTPYIAEQTCKKVPNYHIKLGENGANNGEYVRFVDGEGREFTFKYYNNSYYAYHDPNSNNSEGFSQDWHAIQVGNYYYFYYTRYGWRYFLRYDGRAGTTESTYDDYFADSPEGSENARAYQWEIRDNGIYHVDENWYLYVDFQGIGQNPVQAIYGPDAGTIEGCTVISEQKNALKINGQELKAQISESSFGVEGTVNSWGNSFVVYKTYRENGMIHQGEPAETLIGKPTGEDEDENAYYIVANNGWTNYYLRAKPGGGLFYDSNYDNIAHGLSLNDARWFLGSDGILRNPATDTLLYFDSTTGVASVIHDDGSSPSESTHNRWHVNHEFIGHTADDLPHANQEELGYFIKAIHGSNINLGKDTIVERLTVLGEVKDIAPILIDNSTLNMTDNSMIERNEVSFLADESKRNLPVTEYDQVNDIDYYLKNTPKTNSAGAIIFTNHAIGNITEDTSIRYNKGDIGAILVDDLSYVVLGGAINDDACEVNVLGGGSITGNEGFHYAGAVLVQDGATFRMVSRDSIISDNLTWAKGGAVWATEWGTLASPQRDWVNRVLVNPRDRNTHGGGVFILDDGQLLRNYAFMRAGAVEVESDNVFLNGGIIAENKTRSLGGAIYIEGDFPDNEHGKGYYYSLNLKQGYIGQNVATRYHDDGSGNLHTQRVPAIGSIYDGYSVYQLNNLLDGIDNGDRRDMGPEYTGLGGGVWLCRLGGSAAFNIKNDTRLYIDNNYATGSSVTWNKGIYGTDFYLLGQNSDGNVTVISLAGEDWEDEEYDIQVQEGYIGKGDRYLINNTNNVTPIYEGNHIVGATLLDDNSEVGGVTIVNNLSRDGGAIASDGLVIIGENTDIYEHRAVASFEKIWSNNIEQKYPVVFKMFVKDSEGTEHALDEMTFTLNGQSNVEQEKDETQIGYEITTNPNKKTEDGEDIWEFLMTLPDKVTLSGGTTIPTYLLRNRANYSYTNENGEKVNYIAGTPLDPSNANDVEMITAIAREHSDKFYIDPDDWKIVLKEYTVDGQFVNTAIFEPGELESVNITDTLVHAYNPTTCKFEESHKIYISTVRFAVKAFNDTDAIIEKYINQDVHDQLEEFDEIFEYELMAYVPEDAEEIIIYDTLVDSLMFVDRLENAQYNDDGTVNNSFSYVNQNNYGLISNSNEKQMLSYYNTNNHKIHGTVSDSGDAFNTPYENWANATADADGNKGFIKIIDENEIDLDNPTAVADGNTLWIKINEDNGIETVRGKWVKVTFSVAYKPEYRKMNKWNTTGWATDADDKKGSPISTPLVTYNYKIMKELSDYLAQENDAISEFVTGEDGLYVVNSRNGKRDYYYQQAANGDGKWYKTYVEGNNTKFVALDGTEVLDLGDDTVDTAGGKLYYYNWLNNNYDDYDRSSNENKMLQLDSMLASDNDSIKWMIESNDNYYVITTKGEVYYQGIDDIFVWYKKDKDWLDNNGIDYSNADDTLAWQMRGIDSSYINNNNWPVINGVKLHHGTLNQANYIVSSTNNGKSMHKSNIVTVTVKPYEILIHKVDKEGNLKGGAEFKIQQEAEFYAFKKFGVDGGSYTVEFKDSNVNVLVTKIEMGTKFVINNMMSANVTAYFGSKDLDKISFGYSCIIPANAISKINGEWISYIDALNKTINMSDAEKDSYYKLIENAEWSYGDVIWKHEFGGVSVSALPTGTVAFNEDYNRPSFTGKSFDEVLSHAGRFDREKLLFRTEGLWRDESEDYIFYGDYEGRLAKLKLIDEFTFQCELIEYIDEIPETAWVEYQGEIITKKDYDTETNTLYAYEDIFSAMWGLDYKAAGFNPETNQYQEVDQTSTFKFYTYLIEEEKGPEGLEDAKLPGIIVLYNIGDGRLLVSNKSTADTNMLKIKKDENGIDYLEVINDEYEIIIEKINPNGEPLEGAAFAYRYMAWDNGSKLYEAISSPKPFDYPSVDSESNANIYEHIIDNNYSTVINYLFENSKEYYVKLKDGQYIAKDYETDGEDVQIKFTDNKEDAMVFVGNKLQVALPYTDVTVQVQKFESGDWNKINKINTYYNESIDKVAWKDDNSYYFALFKDGEYYSYNPITDTNWNIITKEGTYGSGDDYPGIGDAKEALDERNGYVLLDLPYETESGTASRQPVFPEGTYVFEEKESGNFLAKTTGSTHTASNIVPGHYVQIEEVIAPRGYEATNQSLYIYVDYDGNIKIVDPYTYKEGTFYDEENIPNLFSLEKREDGKIVIRFKNYTRFDLLIKKVDYDDQSKDLYGAEFVYLEEELIKTLDGSYLYNYDYDKLAEKQGDDYFYNNQKLIQATYEEKNDYEYEITIPGVNEKILVPCGAIDDRYQTDNNVIYVLYDDTRKSVDIFGKAQWKKLSDMSAFQELLNGQHLQYSRIREGTIYIKETKAPAGYSLIDDDDKYLVVDYAWDADEEIFKANINKEKSSKNYLKMTAILPGQATHVKTPDMKAESVYNSQILVVANKAYELPSAGGMGTYLHTILGTMFIALGVFGVRRRVKKFN